uniref:Glyco_transf_64 domain-containing protein n=1 Tax=Globodera pallida TaxID=36090 RepID=A0A183C0I5_GLOPA
MAVSTLQYKHFYNKCGETNNICQILPMKEAKFESTFLLLFTSDRTNFAKNLYVALSCGTIPVFIEDSSEQDLKNLLPVPDLIEWHRATIFLHRQNIEFSSLFLLLKSVPEWKIYELRRMGRFYFQHFLGDPKVLVRTIFTAIRHRLHLPAPPEKTVSAEILFKLLPINGNPETENLDLQFFDEDIHRLWNMDPTYLDSAPKVQPYWRQSHLQYAQNQINSDFYPKFGQKLSGNWLNDEKFTIVIEAFRRDIGLLYTLRSLNGLRYLDRIIVIWGDFDRPITPQSYSWPHIHVPIFLVNTSRNSLNDRFMPLSLIRTEGVLSIDDDFNVDHGTIEFSFRVWRENRGRIVGPNYRIGYLQQSAENYGLTGVYIGPPREEPVFQHCQYNIVLTSGAFIHRDFLTSYSNEMPGEIRAHVDSLTNCEDIAMAFWVSYLTRNGPLKTTPIGNTIGVFVQNSSGLSSRPGHFAQRAKCIKLFSKILGHNPLVISEYRADSLLYNQHVKKCFNNE